MTTATDTKPLVEPLKPKQTVTPDYWRQLGIVTPSELAFPITIIGAGGIGSPTTLLLAKMGCSQLTVIDFDSIEVHNFPNQLYRLEDFGQPKVEALSRIVRAFTGTEIDSQNERFVDQSLNGVVITCLDSMEARRRVWEKARLNIQVPLLIDARMGGQIAQVIAVTPFRPEHIEAYESMLHSDEDTMHVACTEQAIIYNTFMIASVIGLVVKCYAKKQPLPLDGIVKLIDMTQLQLY